MHKNILTPLYDSYLAVFCIAVCITSIYCYTPKLHKYCHFVLQIVLHSPIETVLSYKY